jgi:hypothetical protein
LGKNVNTINKKTEAMLGTSREVGLEVNPENTKYMVISCHWNVGQNHNLLTANKSLKMWQSSSTWEQHKQIKMAFTMKLIPD